jgi:hypothetical protein
VGINFGFQIIPDEDKDFHFITAVDHKQSLLFVGILWPWKNQLLRCLSLASGNDVVV